MGSWVGPGLLAAAVFAPFFLTAWRAWELVALCGVLATAGALVTAIYAWLAVRTRAIELAALTSDEQAARLLGEALKRCGVFLQEKVVREIWDAFATLPSEPKRAMALAIVGYIGESEQYELVGVAPKLVSIARSFREPVEMP